MYIKQIHIWNLHIICKAHTEGQGTKVNEKCENLINSNNLFTTTQENTSWSRALATEKCMYVFPFNIIIIIIIIIVVIIVYYLIFTVLFVHSQFTIYRKRYNKKKTKKNIDNNT